jgi:hypothetical protein
MPEQQADRPEQGPSSAELASALAKATNLVAECSEAFQEVSKENELLKKFLRHATSRTLALLNECLCEPCKATLVAKMKSELAELSKMGVGVEVQRMDESGNVETVAKSEPACDCGEHGKEEHKQVSTQEALASITPFFGPIGHA